jgi:hypothetical protein
MVKVGKGFGLSSGLGSSGLHPTNDSAVMLIDKINKYLSLMSVILMLRNFLTNK